jgi:hypothetical protein
LSIRFTLIWEMPLIIFVYACVNSLPIPVYSINNRPISHSMYAERLFKALANDKCAVECRSIAVLTFILVHVGDVAFAKFGHLQLSFWTISTAFFFSLILAATFPKSKLVLTNYLSCFLFSICVRINVFLLNYNKRQTKMMENRVHSQRPVEANWSLLLRINEQKGSKPAPCSGVCSNAKLINYDETRHSTQQTESFDFVFRAFSDQLFEQERESIRHIPHLFDLKESNAEQEEEEIRSRRSSSTNSTLQGFGVQKLVRHWAPHNADCAQSFRIHFVINLIVCNRFFSSFLVQCQLHSPSAFDFQNIRKQTKTVKSIRPDTISQPSLQIRRSETLVSGLVFDLIYYN